MASFKVYVIFEKDNGNGKTYKLGQYKHVIASDIISAIQQVQEMPELNKYSKAIVKSAEQEA
jgi:hypothetical protein